MAVALPEALHHADTITGGVFGPDGRISREEALRVLTLGNTWLTFEEDLKGSLTTGKLADRVVLSHDILACSDEELRHSRVSIMMVPERSSMRPRGTEAAEAGEVAVLSRRGLG